MAYNKTTWVNKKTALSAANLNNMENGLENVDSRTTKLEEDIKNIDVSEQINEHNISVTSHQDIRSAIENIDVSTQINTHNSNSDAHSLILGSVALSTEDKTVKGAINETLNKVDVLSINVGDTTTLKTDSKKVVGGINENVDKITALSNDRGYLNSKLIPITQDIDTVIENGLYTWEYGENAKKPAGGGSYFVKVQKIVETYVLQEVTMGWGEGKTYLRVMDNGKWGVWKQIATTDKIDISLPYNSGYEHDTAFNYSSVIIINQFKQARIYFNVKKTDGSTFKVGEQHNVATLPSPYLSALNIGGTCTSSHSLICYNTCALYNNILTVYCNVESIAITGHIDYEVV